MTLVWILCGVAAVSLVILMLSLPAEFRRAEKKEREPYEKLEQMAERNQEPSFDEILEVVQGVRMTHDLLFLLIPQIKRIRN